MAAVSSSFDSLRIGCKPPIRGNKRLVDNAGIQQAHAVVDRGEGGGGVRLTLPSPLETRASDPLLKLEMPPRNYAGVVVLL